MLIDELQKLNEVELLNVRLFSRLLDLLSKIAMHGYPGQNFSITGSKIDLNQISRFAGALTGFRCHFIALRRIYHSMARTILGNGHSVCEAALVLIKNWENIPGIDIVL